MRHLLSTLIALGLLEICFGQDIRVPASIVAGNDAIISTSGSGKAILYLIGPGVSRRSDVELGQEVHLDAQYFQTAGAYLALVCSGACQRATFYVNASNPADLTFMVHPSRVPVAQENAISGTVFPFDRFHNLVLSPATINFQLLAGGLSLLSRSNQTQNGIAWFRTTSGKSATSVQAIASLDRLSARRVVQQVASFPCNLRISGQRTPKGLLVMTEPVHDCAGNSVPDGTIVTFTAVGPEGKSTVDAPIKQGVAHAQIASSRITTVSAASGIVIGNELRIGAQQ
jgi:hypothetical protein